METIKDIPEHIPYMGKIVCLFGLLNEDKITPDEFQEAQLRFFDEAYEKTKKKVHLGEQRIVPLRRYKNGC